MFACEVVKAAALSLMWHNFSVLCGKNNSDNAEDADVSKLGRSAPPHPVRCSVMASLSIKILIIFPEKETLKPGYRPTPLGYLEACIQDPNHLQLS